MISVLLCVYNGEKWLQACIESILNQTYKDFEFIIINDGSKDSTLSIIKKYALIDKRIKLINHKNIGLTRSLNKGLIKAKGDWIARIDCDDISQPRRLELQLKYVLKENVGIVGCQCKMICNSSSKIKNIIGPTTNYKILKNLKRQKKFFSHSSVLFNKKLVLKLGGYRECMKRSQDYDLWLRIAEVSRIGCLDYFGVYLRDHINRISNKDKGISQRIFAHAALISHIIRMECGDKYDPFYKKSSDEFLYFLKFVSKSLKKTNTLNFYERIFDFKNNLNKSSLFKKIILIPIYFNNINLIVKLIKWIYSGDFISKKIAKKWLELNKLPLTSKKFENRTSRPIRTKNQP